MLLLSAGHARWRLAAFGVAGFLAELAGTRLSFLFGAYAYSPLLQPQVAGVPVVMACAWMILLAYVKSWLPALTVKPWVAVVAGAVWMTAMDVSIDPVATVAMGYWVWSQPGFYYGVPLSNYRGWLLVSAAWLALDPTRQLGGRSARWVGFSVLVFFGLIALAHQMAGPAAAAVFLSGWHLWLVGRGRRSAQAQPKSD